GPDATAWACSACRDRVAVSPRPAWRRADPPWRWLKAAAQLLLQFFDALAGRLQLSLLGHDDFDPTTRNDPSFAHVLFELLDGVHAHTLSKLPARSCASCLTFLSASNKADNGQLR